MSWKPIVAGVDASPESAAAAAFAWTIAQRAGTSCHLVHATRDPWTAVTYADMPDRMSELSQAQLLVAREQVARSLDLHVPAPLLERLAVHHGRAPLVINDVAAEHDAGLIVLGGKHHTVLGRWLVGSTSHNMVRAASVPVLVTAGRPESVARVLVAVDLSPAAAPTLALAERFAALFGAKTRAISVLEPLPAMPEAPPVDAGYYYRLWEDMLARDVWPRLRAAGAETVVRHGMVIETLLREAREWPADVVVVGSHGKGLAQRVLLGSVTEQLLNHLPVSVLVAPIGAQVEKARVARRAELATA